MIRKIILVATICTLVITLFAAPMSAKVVEPMWHFRNDGSVCSGGIEITVHSGHIGVYVSGSHILEDGSVCLISTLRMEHTVKCSKCNDIFYTFIADCETDHSLCDNHEDCPY